MHYITVLIFVFFEFFLVVFCLILPEFGLESIGFLVCQLDINPKYDGLERSCSKDSKNVTYVELGLVQTDLILSYGWWWPQ